ncbi:MAG: O-antigen ligase family protein, partial [Candidatus Paceibacterota bacterium]
HFASILLIASLLSVKYSRFELCKIIYQFAFIFVAIYTLYFLFSYISHISNSFSPLWPADSIFTIEGAVGIIFSDTLLFSYIRFFNHIQTWTFPLLFSLVLITKQKQQKAVLLILLTIWWALLIQSGGRGTFVAIVLSFFVIISLFDTSRKERAFVFIGSLISGLVTYLVLFYTHSAPFRDITREGTSGRIAMWEKTWAMFLENPVLGKGPLSYSIIQNNELHFAHPHNFYLQILAEWGGFVFIGMFIVIVYVFNNSSKVIKKSTHKLHKELEIGLFGSIIAAFLHAGLSQILHTPLSQVFFLFIIAWLIKITAKGKHIFEFKLYVPSILSMILIIIFLFLSFDSIIEIFNGYETYLETHQTNKMYPRIWGQGLNE